MHVPSLRENLLLRTLPPESLDSLARHATVVEMKESEVVFEADSGNDVFFPIGSVVSLLHEFDDGTEIEISMVGSEGLAGVNIFLGVSHSPYRGLVQGRGFAVCVPAAEFAALSSSDPSLRNLLQRYAHVMLFNASQLAACNRLHVVPERLAHWLLLLHDRADGDEMSLTQEFLARMLATRRAGINVAIRELTATGAIEHRRNRIRVADRRRLEDESCVCYRMMVDEYEKAFGFQPRRSRA